MTKIDIIKIKNKQSYPINDLLSLSLKDIKFDTSDEIIILHGQTGEKLAKIEVDEWDRPRLYFY